MTVPIQITWRRIDQSDAIETAIREKAEKLSHYYDRIQHCRVMLLSK